jgi:hypothetical protein
MILKNKHVFTAIGIFSICFLGLVSPIDVAADGFTCEMRATVDNYWLFIRDLDRDGNPTRDVLYRGWLMRGDTLPLTSGSGRISYTFKADSDYRDSGRNEGLCKNNRILRLPR